MTFTQIGHDINVVSNIMSSFADRGKAIESIASALDSLEPAIAATRMQSAKVPEEIAREVLSRKGLKVAMIDQIMSTYDVSTATVVLGSAQKTVINATGLFTVAITKAKETIRGLWSVLAANPLFWITTAIGFVTTLYQQHTQTIEETRQKTEEATQAFEAESKSIDDSIQKYSELREALLDARGNEERTYSIKKDLLALQKELNDEYGEELDKVNLVTDAYTDQTKQLKEYRKDSAQKYLNDLGDAEIKRITEQITTPTTYELSSEYIVKDSESGKALQKLAQKYSDKGVKTLDTSIGVSNAPETFKITLEADPEEAYETIGAFMSDLRELAKDPPDKSYTLDVSLDKAKMYYDIAKDNLSDLDQYIKLQTSKIFMDDNLSAQYDNAVQAVNNYNDAILKSENPFDDIEVDSALIKLHLIEESIKNDEDTWGEYSSVVNEVFNQTDTRLVQFAQRLRNDGNIESLLAKIIKMRNLSDVDLEALGDADQDFVFNILATKAKDAGLSVDELISIMTQLGIVQNKLMEKDTSKSGMIESINGLSDGFESLDKIRSSVMDADPFDLAQLDDKKFKDTFSDLGEPYKNFIEQLSSSPKDIGACQSAINDLATAWITSSGALKNLSDDTAQLTIDMLTNMGVTNAQEVVETTLAQKHAEAAWAAREVSSANLDVVNTLAEESEATEAAEESFKLYILQKALAEPAFSTTGDIEALKGIVESLGIASSAWQKYYDAREKLDQMNDNKQQYPNGSVFYTYKENGINHIVSQDEYDQIKEDAVKDQRQLALELEEQAKKVRFGGNPAKGKQSGGSKSGNPTELDVAAESVKNLKQQLDSLNTDLQNTDPYSEKIPIILELIKRQNEYNAALQSQAELYLAEYQQSLSALPKDLQDKITGFDNFSIVTVPDSLKDTVSRAQKYRDQWYSVTSSIKSANKELENHQLKLMELAQTRLDDKIGVVQNNATDIQNQMDEAEARGLNTTEGQYKSLIRLARQEEKYNQNKLIGLQAELLLLDEDEDAYYDCLSAIQECENAISKCTQNQAAYNKAILELPIQYLEKANDDLNDELDELQDKQDDLDRAIAGVTGHLQDQIDAQQKLRDEAEETAQKQIDAIQDEIDGLQEANDERKQQLDLEEKLYNLERAKNQKTARIFRESEGEFVYEADSEAVRDAQGEYEDALFDKTISDMEDKIKDIEEARDKLLESYDSEIDRLQKIMDSWDGITDAIQRAKDIAITGEILGSGWQDRVTSGESGDLENLTGQYEKNDKKQTWVEQQIEDNERLIQKVEEYIEAWQMGEMSIREAHEEINDIVGDIMPEIEANDERVSSLSTYTSAWSNAMINVPASVAAVTAAASNNLDELTATEQRRQAAFGYAQEWANSALSVGGSLGLITESSAAAAIAEQGFFGQRVTNITAFKDTYSSMASIIASMCDNIVQSCSDAEDAMRDLAKAESKYGYARGTKNAKPGLHPVAEGNKPEIIIKGNGAAILAKNETYFPFAGGETVLDPSDTQKVIQGDGLTPIDPSQLVISDKQVKAFAGIAGNNSMPSAVDRLIQKSNLQTSNVSTSSIKQGDVIVKFGDLNLPQVKDVDSFTRAITDGSLKSALQQRLLRNK